MGFISKIYLQTQFTNFANRISQVFSKKTETQFVHSLANKDIVEIRRLYDQIDGTSGKKYARVAVIRHIPSNCTIVDAGMIYLGTYSDSTMYELTLESVGTQKGGVTVQKITSPDISSLAYTHAQRIGTANKIGFTIRGFVKYTYQDAEYVTYTDHLVGNFGDARGGLVVSTEGQIKFGIDENGNYGYYKVGADTVTPFKNGEKQIICNMSAYGGNYNVTTSSTNYGLYVDIKNSAFDIGSMKKSAMVLQTTSSTTAYNNKNLRSKTFSQCEEITDGLYGDKETIGATSSNAYKIINLWILSTLIGKETKETFEIVDSNTIKIYGNFFPMLYVNEYRSTNLAQHQQYLDNIDLTFVGYDSEINLTTFDFSDCNLDKNIRINYPINGINKIIMPKRDVELSMGSFASSQIEAIENDNYIKSIGDYALTHTNLIDLDCSNLISIGYYGLGNCQKGLKLKNVGNITTLQPYAFVNSYFSSNTESVFSSLTQCGSYAFNGTILNSISLPLLTLIPISAFYSSAIKQIEAPSATKIDSNAFYNCLLLENAKFGDLTTINSQAFYNCSNSNLVLDFTNCTTVPTLASTNAFTNLHTNAKIKVPSSLYQTWISATNWTAVADKIIAV